MKNGKHLTIITARSGSGYWHLNVWAYNGGDPVLRMDWQGNGDGEAWYGLRADVPATQLARFKAGAALAASVLRSARRFLEDGWEECPTPEAVLAALRRRGFRPTVGVGDGEAREMTAEELAREIAAR